MAAIELHDTPLFSDTDLASYYRMEGNANDSKGANNGTSTSVTYSTGNGKFNQGGGFAGSPSKIAMATMTGIPVGNTHYAMGAWIKISVSFTGAIIGWGTVGTTNFANVLKLQSSTQVTNYWWGNDLLVTVTSLADSAWHLVGCDFDGTTRRIWVDGVAVGSDTPGSSHNAQASNFTIGSFNGEWFKGTMDDVFVFSRNLTAAEWSNLYNGSWNGGGYIFIQA